MRATHEQEWQAARAAHILGFLDQRAQVSIQGSAPAPRVFPVAHLLQEVAAGLRDVEQQLLPPRVTALTAPCVPVRVALAHAAARVGAARAHEGPGVAAGVGLHPVVEERSARAGAAARGPCALDECSIQLRLLLANLRPRAGSMLA